jgi:hypothetical protein
VVGKLDLFDPAAKLAVASCDSAYEGLTLRRTVQLCRHCVVDQFSIQPAERAAAQRRFDYVLHVDGDFTDSSVLLQPRSGRLGDGCGYQRVEQKQGTTTAGGATLRFTSERQQFRVWIVPTDESPTEVIVAEGPTNSPKETRPMLILRRTAAATRFVTVLGPVNQAQSLRGVRTEKDPDGRQVWPVLEWSTGSDRIRLGDGEKVRNRS